MGGIPVVTVYQMNCNTKWGWLEDFILIKLVLRLGFSNLEAIRMSPIWLVFSAPKPYFFHKFN